MWRNEIKSYKTEDQFIKHRQVLIDLRKYYLLSMDQSSKSVKNLDSERAELERCYKKWKREKASRVENLAKMARGKEKMNSRKLWGAHLRANIQTYVRENGEVSRKEIIDQFGKEAETQIRVLVERGGLVRQKRGFYSWQEQKAQII